MFSLVDTIFLHRVLIARLHIRENDGTTTINHLWGSYTII